MKTIIKSAILILFVIIGGGFSATNGYTLNFGENDGAKLIKLIEKKKFVYGWKNGKSCALIPQKRRKTLKTRGNSALDRY
ncbi:MAG: hypothetical protein IPJ40_07705 [Saprospirales bacterium]|nr:hypothetical protein [Saprospirales bacterium]